MGRNASRLAEIGRRRLEALELAGLNLPAMRDQMCSSCACRPGTVPNGCLQTQLDLLKAVIEGAPFFCHAPHDGRMCAGWLRMRAEHAANPLPTVAQDIVARWKYSPPDDQ
jgi:hypothetical protein